MFKAVSILELICFFVEVLAAMNGAAIGVFGMFFIGAIAIAMMRATLSTKRTINELKERKEEPPAKGLQSGNVSPVLLAGLFLNLAATSLSNRNFLPEYLVTGIQITAILLMLIGLYQSRNVFTDK